MSGNIDFVALRTARNAVGRPIAAQATPSDITVGVDGASFVFKNGNGYLRDNAGLYHLMACYVVEGQIQVTLANTGYAYNSIP